MKRAVTLILTLGVLLNSFVSLRNLDIDPYDILDNVIAAESSALGIFSAAALPFRILNSLVRKGSTLCDQIKGQPKEKGNHPPRNSASEYSLNCFEYSVRLMGDGKECGSAVFELRALFDTMQAGSCCKKAVMVGMNFVRPYLLVYIVLISRMSIPGWMRICRQMSNMEPSLIVKTGFFI
jgi:hypothetical protein